ncbi:MAG: ABC transporter substrate-binding protein, partial [Janthinobacterium lividum]
MPNNSLAAALCAGLLTLFALPASAASKPLTVCTEASPDGFDIVQYNSLVTTNASADVIFDGLVAFDETKGTVVPALAERWEVTPDGLSYTFHLRHDVQFQTTDSFKPTRALNADDVLFSFQRMLDPANPWHKVAGPGGFPHAQSMQLPKLIKAVVKVGDQTVRFDLSEPNATFLSILTMGFASIYSADYANQLLKAGQTGELNDKPVGTGPFMLRSYQKDAVIRYDVNPHYWGKKPSIDRLIYVITPDASVRAQKVKAGECQIALAPKPQDVATARSDSNVKVLQSNAFMTAFVAINTQHKPLDNQKVRQAINMAFDRTAYLKAVFDGMATPAVNPYPPSTWSYASALKPYPHDVAQAKKLLAEAGFPNGFSTTLWTRP